MLYNFFKAKKSNVLNLLEKFNKECSFISSSERRSSATQKLVKIIKGNTILNYNGSNLDVLSLESLQADNFKITKVLNATCDWCDERGAISARVGKVLNFRSVLTDIKSSIEVKIQEKMSQRAEKKCNSINLLETFNKECSLTFYKYRSPATQKLTEIIKKNSSLNYDGINPTLPLACLRDDLDKVANIFDAIYEWLDKRSSVTGKNVKNPSERIRKVLDFRDNYLIPFANQLLNDYTQKGGMFEQHWQVITPPYRPFKQSSRPIFNLSGFIISMPFASQLFDSLPDLIGLLN